MEKEQIIEKIKELKHKVLPDGKLFLFGSRAKGTATAESDWDLLILLDKDSTETSDFERYAYPFVELGWQLGEYFSPKLYSAKEWHKRIMSPFYKNVTTEGVELEEDVRALLLPAEQLMMKVENLIKDKTDK